jgi:hypothetical protein
MSLRTVRSFSGVFMRKLIAPCLMLFVAFAWAGREDDFGKRLAFSHASAVMIQVDWSATVSPHSTTTTSPGTGTLGGSLGTFNVSAVGEVFSIPSDGSIRVIASGFTGGFPNGNYPLTRMSSPPFQIEFTSVGSQLSDYAVNIIDNNAGILSPFSNGCMVNGVYSHCFVSLFDTAGTGEDIATASLGLDGSLDDDSLGTITYSFSYGSPNKPDVVATGPVAHYLFSGNGKDSSGSGNHGTANGVVSTADRNGAANSAYQFDGKDDHILITNNASLDISNFQNGYTLAAWIYPEKVSKYRDIISKGNNGFSLRLNGKVLEACHRAVVSTGCQTAKIRIAKRKWSHVAVTWNGKTSMWQMYLNGKPGEYTGNMLTLATDNEGNVAIGKDSQYDRWYFAGKIDDVRIYNRGLSATEIMQLAAPQGK